MRSDENPALWTNEKDLFTEPRRGAGRNKRPISKKTTTGGGKVCGPWELAQMQPLRSRYVTRSSTTSRKKRAPSKTRLKSPFSGSSSCHNTPTAGNTGAGRPEIESDTSVQNEVPRGKGRRFRPVLHHDRGSRRTTNAPELRRSCP